MTDITFYRRKYVRIDTDPVAWLVVEPGQTLATVQPYSTFADYADAVAAGYDGDEPEPPADEVTVSRLRAVEDALDDLILAALEGNDV